MVTIVFADMVGSTTLAERLDAEDMLELFSGALSALASVVEASQGRVMRFTGDGLKAVFGADAAREDDAERAVRCGLAMLATAREHAARLREERDWVDLQIRVGIHTGHVALGGGVEGVDTAIGSAVHVAARMEQSAPPGGLRISHDTYRHVRGVFEVQPQPPLQVPGVKEPVVTYLVQKAKPRAFRIATRGIEGIETRMIGRDAELGQLQRAFHALLAGGTLAFVTVVGEAGVGKSRLLYEFRNWAEARPERYKVFQGRATPQTVSQSYGMLRDVLARRLEIAESDSMAVAKAKLEAAIVPLFEADDGAEMAQAHAHVLGHLIGMDFGASPHVKGIAEDARQIRNRAFHTAAQVVRRIAADGAPVILYLEDLHWADDGSIDFLNYLARVGRDLPILIVCLARPALYERRKDWGNPEGMHRRVDVTTLDPGSTLLLAEELLKKLPDVPASLREVVTAGAGGNPFYMEELVKMLVDQGAIETGPELWTLHAEKLQATEVPSTLTGVIQARLDGLPAPERLALQQASVLGSIFWDATLAAIDPRAPEALPALVRRELIVAHKDAAFEGLREFAFYHQILHQVTYETLVKRNRRAWHAKAAAWMAGLSGARAGDFLGATAEHYESAGDLANAREFFTRAAEHARGRYLNASAIDFVARALALVGEEATPEASELRWRLMAARERALDVQGKRAEQQIALDALERLADELDDDGRRAFVAAERGNFAIRTGDNRGCEQAARRAIALAERAGAVELCLRGQSLLVGALRFLGDIQASTALALDSLAVARARGFRREEGLLLNQLGVTTLEGGDRAAALAMFRQLLETERELGSRRGEAAACNNIGTVLLELGEYREGRWHLEDAARLSRATGDLVLQSCALHGLSIVAQVEGDLAEGKACAQLALDIAVEGRDPVIEIDALCALATALEASGDFGTARALCERALAVATAKGLPMEHKARMGIARAALAAGDTEGAAREVEILIASLDRGDCGAEALIVQIVCYRVLARIGDGRAISHLQSAHASLQAAAARIQDAALRRGFLENVPEHRDIVAAWKGMLAP
jgi:class 3 adenylate cyclase/predicted ATPase